MNTVRMEPTVRCLSAPLTSEMRTALRYVSTGHGTTARGMVARRLWVPGSSGAKIRMTPMGEQWHRDVLALATARENLAKAQAELRVIREAMTIIRGLPSRGVSDGLLDEIVCACNRGLE